MDFKICISVNADNFKTLYCFTEKWVDAHDLHCTELADKETNFVFENSDED